MKAPCTHSPGCACSGTSAAGATRWRRGGSGRRSTGTPKRSIAPQRACWSCWRDRSMSRDVAIPDQAPARARPRPAANLTQRASLNVVASLLDYGAKIAVNFLVIPILVTGLGRSLYGVWEMLGRLVGYLTAGDGRPTQALRLVVATMQASDDDAAKRRYVGAAFVVWILFLPVILAAGAVLVWAAPTITQAPP